MSSITRRQFLGKSAASTATMFTGLVLSSRGMAHAVGPNDKIRIGVIGCGGMGIGDMSTFFRFPEVECPIVCDVDDAQIAKAVELVEGQFDKKPDTTKDFRNVIDRNDIDAVLIATPDHWHALPTVFACQTGKDVYVEKPLATSVAEGRAMVKAALDNNRVVQMGTHWPSAKHFQEVFEIVKSGRLGKMRLVRVWAHLDWIKGIGNPPDSDPPAGVDYDMWLGPTPKRPFNPNRFHFNFRWFWDYAGGLMTDWGVHMLNLVMMAMGNEHPKTISSAGGRFVLDDNTETPDTQFALYDFPSYTMVWEHQIEGGLGINGKPAGFAFMGNDATLYADFEGWNIVSEKGKNVKEESGKTAGDPRPNHVKNFLECMRSRQKPIEHIEFAHFSSTIAHLGNVAFRAGRQITWDPEKEKIKGDSEANRLLKVKYRAPWKLPYY